VSAVLGVIHFWMSVKADIRDPLMYAAVFATLFAYRIRAWRQRAAPARP
jgi:sulfoxide reductase heme-binding subunit YedZ